MYQIQEGASGPSVSLYSGFTVTCKAEVFTAPDGTWIACGSKNVVVENTLRYHPESGAWGDVSLVCRACGQRSIIAEVTT